MKGMLGTAVLAEVMKLKEMGAKIQFVSGKICHVRFEEAGIQIEYAYSINSKGKYHLDRLKPYPLPLREFVKEEKLIEIIEIDLEQFRNAIRAQKNLQEFIETSTKFHHMFQRFEDLYLYFDITSDTLEDIHHKLNEIDEVIKTATKSHTRIYHKKEPDNL